jgi:HK97 family phage portal protein
MNIFKRLEYAWKHRGQSKIQELEGTVVESSSRRVFFEKSYDSIEVVRRGTDMIVDNASEIDVNITGQLPGLPTHEGAKVRMKTLFNIINFSPNRNEDVSSYRRQLCMDLVLTGNCYQYWDSKSKSLFQLPSQLMEVHTHTDNKVSHYTLNDDIRYEVSEIIHTKDNSSTSVYTGKSRLFCTKDTVILLKRMLDFQENFFKNGAIPGLIIQTPNILGDRIKQKLLASWKQRYNPSTGGKNPMILDGDLKVNPLSQTKFNELDFEDSIASHELKILKALGVPPILLDSGNNANLRPNIQLFYEMTVLPLVAKLISSYERFFAYDMEPDVVKVRSLRPELNEAAQYYQGLVNTGIMTINEARKELRLDPSPEPHADELRIPQNIAGSAEDPTEGGRPPDSEEEDD